MGGISTASFWTPRAGRVVPVANLRAKVPQGSGSLQLDPDDPFHSNLQVKIEAAFITIGHHARRRTWARATTTATRRAWSSPRGNWRERGWPDPFRPLRDPEMIAGYTDVKAGTAQKVALNIISTGVFTRLGHMYRGRMVDVVAAKDKVRRCWAS